MVKLTSQQEKAVEKMREWFESEKQLFCLAGYAGTGKSFLISHFVSSVLNLDEDDYIFCAPTGKAAVILMKKGMNAVTLHKLIYDVVEVENKAIIDEEEVVTKKLVFKKKTSIPKYKIIILDEVSMVGDELMKDLLSFGIKILASGDPGQLPAIASSNNFLEEPDFQLTEIVRQEADNPIVKIATMAREGRFIPYGNYGTVLVMNKKNLSESQRKRIFTGTDQVICGKNITREKLNKEIRGYLGIDPNKKLPEENEKVICIVNNWGKTSAIYENIEISLVNGLVGNVKNVEDGHDWVSTFEFTPDFIENYEKYYFDSKLFETGEFHHERGNNVFILADGSFRLRKKLKRSDFENSKEYRNAVKKFTKLLKEAVEEEPITFFIPAHALSCHKAQGSEWDSVCVIDESRSFPEPEKWLYTAITRAKKKLIIIR